MRYAFLLVLLLFNFKRWRFWLSLDLVFDVLSVEFDVNGYCLSQPCVTTYVQHTRWGWPIQSFSPIMSIFCVERFFHSRFNTLTIWLLLICRFNILKKVIQFLCGLELLLNSLLHAILQKNVYWVFLCVTFDLMNFRCIRLFVDGNKWFQLNEKQNVQIKLICRTEAESALPWSHNEFN